MPFASRGDGFGGTRRSEVRVEVRLVTTAGELRLSGRGTGRPKNVVSGAERVAGTVVEKILLEGRLESRTATLLALEPELAVGGKGTWSRGSWWARWDADTVVDAVIAFIEDRRGEEAPGLDLGGPAGENARSWPSS